MRILVVDDNQDGAVSMASALVLLKHEVRVAFNGNSAVKISGLFRPNLVLLDIAMSGIDGYETCRVIRRLLGKEVRIVAVTGLTVEVAMRQGAQAGFDDHLLKPVDWAVLMGILRSIQHGQPRS